METPASKTAADKSVFLVHVGGIAVMVACFLIGLYVSAKVHREIGGIIIGAGFFIYGKFGFKPAAAVTLRELAKLLEISVAEAKRISAKPPALDPPPAPSPGEGQ